MKWALFSRNGGGGQLRSAGLSRGRLRAPTALLRNLPSELRSSAHSRSAELFMLRVSRSALAGVELCILGSILEKEVETPHFVSKAAGSRSDCAERFLTCGAEMRRSEAEGRSPKAIAKRCASTRAGAPPFGVDFDDSDGVVGEQCQKMGKLQRQAPFEF